MAILTLTPSLVLAAKIELEATIDRNTCTVGERLTYTVTVTGKVTLPDIKPPDFDGFEIVMGPSTSTQIEMINGRVSRSKSLTYTIRPRKPGKLVIQPATASYKRRKYKSKSITVEVISAGQPPTSTSRGSDFDAGQIRHKKLPDVFLSAKVDKDTVYRLEMITVSYDLYFKKNVSNYSFPRLPQAKGFWQEEFKIPNRPTVRDATVRGVAYKVATLRKVGLFPTRTGALKLEPLTADITVELPTQTRRRRSLWDDPFFSRNRTEVRSVTTQPLELTVLDLPREGRPYNFKGDVGDFRLRVSYDKNKLAQHEALNVKITIDGRGYLKSIDAPKLNLPDGFEQFDPTVSENITTSGGKMRGKKTYNYLVIPRRSGTFNLKSIQFSYFDPAAGEYKKSRAGGKQITVTPAAESEFFTGVGAVPEEVAILGSDIRFIKELEAPLSPIVRKAYESVWFYIALAFPPLLFLFGLSIEYIARQRASDPAAVRLRKAPEIMRKSLKDASRLISQNRTEDAIALAAHGLTEMTGAVIREPSAGLTSITIENGLKEAGAIDDLTQEVNNLISEADHIRFSGVEIDVEKAKVIIERFRDATVHLEKLR